MPGVWRRDGEVMTVVTTQECMNMSKENGIKEFHKRVTLQLGLEEEVGVFK